MTLTELRETINHASEANPKRNEIKIEYYKKFTIPFACFVMGLLGIPLGVRKTRGGRSYGFVISLAILLSYYILLVMAESFGESGKIPPLIAMWIPNMLMGALGIYLFIHAARESTPMVVVWLNRFIANILTRIKRRDCFS